MGTVAHVIRLTQWYDGEHADPGTTAARWRGLVTTTR